jgi:hypothetical protein
MGAPTKRICDRWFVPMSVAAADGNVRYTALRLLVGIDLCGGDRLRHPVTLLSAHSWPRGKRRVSTRA